MYEFQSLICQLLGMDVANTGMYDGATAMAEAALMACRVTGRDNIAVLDSVSPAYRDVLHTYANPQGINISIISQKKPKLPQRTAALLAQHPNYFGYFERLQALGETAHQEKAFFVVSVDPIAIALFPPPSEYDADIVTAEAQPLGIPLSFGGPYVGLFTTKAAYMRQLPGRIVGKTTDAEGRTGYVLTLQTREQHIRRERATSNICTSEALAALAVTIHLAAMGPKGLRAMSELCYHKAHYAATNIALLPGYNLPFNGIFFREFVVQCPIQPSKLNTLLLENGIIGGLDISNHIPNGMLLCVTEMNTRQEIDTLVTSLKEASR
jgi:glycine dehydrogenase subunit 1